MTASSRCRTATTATPGGATAGTSGEPAVTTSRTAYLLAAAAATVVATMPPWLCPTSATGSSAPIPAAAIASSTAPVMTSGTPPSSARLVPLSVGTSLARPAARVPGIATTHATDPSARSSRCTVTVARGVPGSPVSVSSS
ncbi:hypothetical protein [Cellulomonas iranensis]|uniref:Uncharacterized protein n=1 Tax=Cellulomonas iranensis TaxID=76862 RepID=A0ABU0GJG2_9CELL|nr:hypothetical protein [Cellulomonas iranensis]MDQ0425508.1 hypothetical protein [Cellulomonas iranensis]